MRFYIGLKNGEQYHIDVKNADKAISYFKEAVRKDRKFNKGAPNSSPVILLKSVEVEIINVDELQE